MTPQLAPTTTPHNRTSCQDCRIVGVKATPAAVTASAADADGTVAGRPAGLAGFNWTKIHPPGPADGGGGDAGLGEIFVIGVDPDHQGTGLGRALAIAGLESLAARGVRTGLLYVDKQASDMHDTSGTTELPLSRLPFENLCPGKAALDELQSEFR